MGLLDRFKAKTIEDPFFGRVRFDKRHVEWDGAVRFTPLGTEVLISISGDESGPTTADRESFQRLARRYAELSDSLAHELFDLYSPFLEGPEPSLAQSPQELWSILELNVITITGLDQFELLYAFHESVGWDDAMFTVEMSNWQPKAVSLDD
jgi:hypothetical protein